MDTLFLPHNRRPTSSSRLVKWSEIILIQLSLHDFRAATEAMAGNYYFLRCVWREWKMLTWSEREWW